MGKKTQSPPQPDYTGAANAQGQANLEAARTGAKLSNPNISTPWGGRSVTWNGDIPTMTDTLSPGQQQLFNQQQGNQLGLSSLAQRSIGNLLGNNSGQMFAGGSSGFDE